MFDRMIRHRDMRGVPACISGIICSLSVTDGWRTAVDGGGELCIAGQCIAKAIFCTFSCVGSYSYTNSTKSTSTDGSGRVYL